MHVINLKKFLMITHFSRERLVMIIRAGTKSSIFSQNYEKFWPIKSRSREMIHFKFGAII